MTFIQNFPNVSVHFLLICGSMDHSGVKVKGFIVNIIRTPQFETNVLLKNRTLEIGINTMCNRLDANTKHEWDLTLKSNFEIILTFTIIC